MIRAIKPDKEKAASLKKMAKITLERLEKTDKINYPTNTLTDYYDVIHKLMESISLINGIKIKGESAHKELIEYISSELRFNQQTTQFLQQMREYRNRISYEGFMINKNYIMLSQKQTDKIIKNLFKGLEKCVE